jgi:hypothetical protein
MDYPLKTMRVAILIGAIGAASTGLALDLTPESSTRELEGGFKVPVLHFRDGTSKVEYRPPPGWILSGGGGALTLQPGEAPQAIARMSLVPRNARDGSVAAGGVDLEKYAANRLPAGALEVERVASNESPFMLGALPSREFQYRYLQSTASFKNSISIVDLNEKGRLVVEVIAGSTHFASVRDAMIGSLFSWSWEN